MEALILFAEQAFRRSGTCALATPRCPFLVSFSFFLGGGGWGGGGGQGPGLRVEG